MPIKIIRKDIKKNRNILFIFGDNDERTGFGGMAKEFRDEPNSLGIRTKKKPSTDSESYYTDEEYDENCKKINEDIEAILKEARSYAGVWITRQTGQGLANMPAKCPKTYEYLSNEIERLLNILKKRAIKDY